MAEPFKAFEALRENQKLGREFQKLDRVFKKLGRVFVLQHDPCCPNQSRYVTDALREVKMPPKMKKKGRPWGAETTTKRSSLNDY